MDVQTVTMLSWAYATSAPYNKDLFATFCDVALKHQHHFHIRVRRRRVHFFDPFLSKRRKCMTGACAEHDWRGIALLCLVQICIFHASPTSDPWMLPCQALSNFTWACARVGHYNEELFDVVAARVAGKLDDICSFDLGSLAWGLGKAYGELGVKGPSLKHEERESAIMRYLSEKPVRERVGLLHMLPCITPDLHLLCHLT